MFCKYCGNEVPDGYVCNCPEAAAARAAAEAPVATAAPAAPAASPVGDAFKALPTSAKSLLANTEGPGTNVITGAIYAAGSLILNILAWVLIVAGLLGSLKSEVGNMAWDYMKKMFDGIYGYAVLGGLWTCVIPIALSIGIIVVGQLIRKEKVDIIPAFTTAASISVAPSVVFLVGALFTTFLGGVGVFLILVGIIMAMASNYKLIAKFVANTNGFIGGLITAAIIAVVIALMAWVVSGVLTGYVEGPMAENLGAGIEDILGLILGGGF
ncbi:MAG: hypothetical protein E7448_04255 [Ruminococcaceae bacterium]|nr:hypothetical protein [Oscillospiraceae bacterium]